MGKSKNKSEFLRFEALGMLGFGIVLCSALYFGFVSTGIARPKDSKCKTIEEKVVVIDKESEQEHDLIFSNSSSEPGMKYITMFKDSRGDTLKYIGDYIKGKNVYDQFEIGDSAKVTWEKCVLPLFGDTSNFLVDVQRY